MDNIRKTFAHLNLGSINQATLTQLYYEDIKRKFFEYSVIRSYFYFYELLLFSFLRHRKPLLAINLKINGFLIQSYVNFYYLLTSILKNF